MTSDTERVTARTTDRAASRALTGAQAVAQVIARQERPIVYGMPGGYTMHIYDALFPLGDAAHPPRHRPAGADAPGVRPARPGGHGRE
ncbi:hypothetical protein ABZ372_50925, partial [Streptomyces sp. NPDC005921]